MIKRKFLFWILLFLLNPTIAYDEPIKISVHIMPTLVEQDDKGEMDGIIIRRLREAICRAGLEAEFQVLPWKRAYSELKNATVDVLAPMLRNPEREELFDFSRNNIHTPRYVLAVRYGYRKLKTAPKDLSKLAQFEIDYVRGYSLMERLDSVKGKYIPVEGGSFDTAEAVKKLIRGRCDVIIADEDTLKGTLYELGAIDKVFILKPAIQVKNSYIAFSKAPRFENILDLLDNALESMMMDGSFEKIADNYLAGKKANYQCDE